MGRQTVLDHTVEIPRRLADFINAGGKIILASQRQLAVGKVFRGISFSLKDGNRWAMDQSFCVTRETSRAEYDAQRVSLRQVLGDICRAEFPEGTVGDRYYEVSTD